MTTLEQALARHCEGWPVVVLENISVIDAIERKYSLIRDGLILDTDFSWAYRQSEYDGFTMNRPAHVVFAFRDPAVASFYQLKWA